MNEFARLVHLLLLCAGIQVCVSARAADVAAVPDDIAVVAASPSDQPAVDRLVVLVDVPFDIVDAGKTDEILRDRQYSVVIVIDGESRRVLRYGLDDQDARVRELSRDGPAPSAYQLAFVAAELLGMRDAAAPERPIAATTHPRTRLGGRLGFGIANTFEGVPVLPGGSLGLALAHGRNARRITFVSDLDLSLAGLRNVRIAVAEELAVRRAGAAVRLGVQKAVGSVAYVAAVEASGYRTRVALGADERVVHRGGLAVGLRAELRLTLASFCQFFAGLSATSAFARNDYRFAGESALRERRFAMSGSAGLIFMRAE